MTFSLYRPSLRAALAACAALLAACTPSARTGGSGPAPDLRSAPPSRRGPPDAPASEISQWVRRECGSRFRNKQACVERTLVALIDQTGIGRTMEVLDTLVSVDSDVRFNAHALAHGLGIAAYRTPETLAATFAACPPTQMSGCYHGVVQGYFLSLARQGRLPGTPELDAMCEPHRGTIFLFFQCAHGMGHGLMAVHDNHVPMSLDACDLAVGRIHPRVVLRRRVHGERGARHPSAPHRGGPRRHAGRHDGHDAQPAAADAHAAHGGAQAAEHHDAHAGHAAGPPARAGCSTAPGSRWTATTRCIPCNAVAEKYQESCYTMQTSAILYFNGGDVAATARACERAPAAMVDTCFGSLGRDITALAAQNHAALAGACAGAPRGRRPAAASCGARMGVAQNLVNVAADPDEGLRFCRAVSGADPKARCYRAVGRDDHHAGDRRRTARRVVPGRRARVRRHLPQRRRRRPPPAPKTSSGAVSVDEQRGRRIHSASPFVNTKPRIKRVIPISRVYCALKGDVPRAHGSTTGYEHLRVDFSVGAKP